MKARLIREILNEFEASLSKDLSKEGIKHDIEKETVENTDFRRVLYTGKNIQLVLMTLEPEENIGLEVHDVDQFFRFEKGNGLVIVNEKEYYVKDGDSVIIPAGAKHDVINTGDGTLNMYTLYAPPHHEVGVVHKTKEEATSDDEEWEGRTTE